MKKSTEPQVLPNYLHAKKTPVIVPAILCGSVETAQQQLNQVRAIPGIKVVQFDTIDGWFADNLTLTPVDLLGLDFGHLKVDIHLMTDEPMDYVFEALEYKDTLPIRSIIGQIEHMSSQSQFVEQVYSVGWQAGLSLDLFTPLEEVDLGTLAQLKILQIMGIEAGFQGQEFASQVLDVVKEARELRQQQQAEWEICVDGGVKLQNIGNIVAAGADILAVGTTLWQAADSKKAYADLQASIESEIQQYY